VRTIKSTVTIASILIALAAFSCDMGSSLFTDEEIDSMYDIRVMQDGASLTDGSSISTLRAIDISVSSIEGARAPALLNIEISRADGEEVANLSFVSGTTSRDDAIPVVDFSRGIPAFKMPAGLGEGYYIVTTTLRDSAGVELTQSSVVVLSSSVKMDPPSISVYPGTVASGDVSLFKLEGSFPPGLDPWIRWKVDGTVFSEGLMLDRADRIIWTAPASGGVYEVSAEIFPYAPPAGHIVPASARVGVRLPVSTRSGKFDVFADLDSWSILTLDGKVDDQGPRPRASEPRSTGEPFLETYASGFGFLLGNGRGIVSSSSLLPVGEKDGRLSPFTAVFMLADATDGVDSGNGYLLTANLKDDSVGLLIGVSGGYPYVQSGSSRVAANLKLVPELSRLAVQITPTASGASVVFYINEAAAGVGTISSSMLKNATAACVIAGDGGYPAIYDEIRILRGPYPAYLVAERTNKGARVVAASGFEGGIPGKSFLVAGEGAVSIDGSLSLASDSSLTIDTSGFPSGSSSLSFELLSGAATVSLGLENGETLAIHSSGNISYDAGIVQSRIELGNKAHIEFTARITGKGIELSGTKGDSIVLPVLPAAGAHWIIKAAPGEMIVITNVLLATVELPLSRAPEEVLQDNSAPLSKIPLETAGLL